MKLINKIWNVCLDALLPPICLCCRSHLGTEIEKENSLCENCFGQIKVYQNIFYINPRDRLLAVGPYDNAPLRELIHGLKYKHLLTIKKPLGKLIRQYLNNVNAEGVIDRGAVVVPIPLHFFRHRQRGFNQAELIANIVAEQLKLTTDNKVLKRIKSTKQQVNIKGNEKRLENVRGCFALAPGAAEKIRGKEGVLVDDVYTSGATVREAIVTLRRAGIKEISVFVLAKAG